MIDAQNANSTRPYLIRALYEWCTDNGLTPYVAVVVDETVQVPREYVKDGEIVLNISMDATSALKLGNDFIEFKARFAGTAREIMVPVTRVVAVYARETGQGMAFALSEAKGRPLPTEEMRPTLAPVQPSESSAREAHPGSLTRVESEDTAAKPGPNDAPKPPSSPRPTLTRVK